jgi:hypothetical protein
MRVLPTGAELAETSCIIEIYQLSDVSRELEHPHMRLLEEFVSGMYFSERLTDISRFPSI